MKTLMFLSAVILIIGVFFIKQSSKNIVCKTLWDYYSDRDNNKNCYYNPDGELTTPEIIKRWGYNVETHTITTEDGYILTLFRIPGNKNSSSSEAKGPVLIQHGYKSNSRCYVSTGKKSLGFFLADHGYDVWLPNFRGTKYSRNHINLKDTDEKFWDFSFHEMGVYDTKANIDYIYKLTKQKIIYIGFSMGTTTGAIYSTTYPKIAEDKVKILIQLAPYVFADGMGIHNKIMLTLWPYTAPIGQALTGGQFYPRPYSEVIISLWKFFCQPYPIQMGICTLIDMWIFGFDYDQVDPETFPVSVFPSVDTVSIKTLTHVSQFVTSGNFQNYDYGHKENLRRYGHPQPPLYNLSDVRVPAYIVRSENDLMCGKEGIEKYYSALPEKARPYDIYVVNYDKFNHIDFVLAKDVVSLLYIHLVEFMNRL